MRPVAGRVAVVTGAGGGVGMAVVRGLAEVGANVVCADIDPAAAERAADLVRMAGAQAVAQTVDVSSVAGAGSMVEAAIDAWGRIDILHNNAALTSLDAMRGDGPAADTDPDVFDQILAVNLRGPFLACRAALPHMVAAGAGVVINTSSVHSLLGDDRLCAYSSSKGALNAFTRHVATAYGRHGVRCNALALGVVDTPSMQAARDTAQVRGFVAAAVTGRPVAPEEVAATVVFLASDAAASITGQVIPIDGGHTAHVPWWRGDR